MEFRSSYKYARISARKVRLVANLIRGKFADDALDILKFQPQRGARMLEKVLKAALGNARDPEQTQGKQVRVDRLVVAEARVDGGPMFKRVMPKERGMAHMIKCRMAHIHITLAEL